MKHAFTRAPAARMVLAVGALLSAALLLLVPGPGSVGSSVVSLSLRTTPISVAEYVGAPVDALVDADEAMPDLPLAARIRGMGRLARFACLLCVGVFLGAAGTSVAGVLATAVAFPEFMAACGAACGIGYL